MYIILTYRTKQSRRRINNWPLKIIHILIVAIFKEQNILVQFINFIFNLL
jgi:hypothetical protein